MSRKRIIIVSLALGLALAVFYFSRRWAEDDKPRYTISIATTHIKGPLDADGRLDYTTALNEQLCKGITPETNANAMLWQVYGPKSNYQVTDEYFGWLGIAKPAEAGQYIEQFATYLERIGKRPQQPESEKYWEAFEELIAKPWKAADLPDAAEWLDSLAQLLAMAHEALRQQHYYSPIVPARRDDGTSLGLALSMPPKLSDHRELCMTLLTRAMLHLGEGRAAASWNDLNASHRLGVLVGQGGTLHDFMVSVAIVDAAIASKLVFLSQPNLSPELLEACIADMNTLPPRRTLADIVNLTERLTFLDTIMMLETQRNTYFKELNLGERSRIDDPMITARILRSIDWDPALAEYNVFLDRMYDCLREPEPVKLNRTEVDFRNIEGLISKHLQSGTGFMNSAADRGRAVCALVFRNRILLLRLMVNYEARSIQSFTNISLALALARHKAETGTYPDALAALAPKYIKEVPGDLYSGKELIYKPAEGGYMLYSVGPNGADDGGRGRDADPPGDDIVIRMPGGK